MKKALLILALPLIQLAATQAFAADTAAPAAAKTRVEVKDEAKMAAKTGDTATKTGEAGPAAVIEKKPAAGTNTRKEVKDETKAAAKSGDLPKAGEAAAAQDVDKKPTSTKARADVKAGAKAAVGDKEVKIGGDNTKIGK